MLPSVGAGSVPVCVHIAHSNPVAVLFSWSQGEKTPQSVHPAARSAAGKIFGVFFYTRPSAKLPAHACLAASPLTLQPPGQASSPAPPPCWEPLSAEKAERVGGLG